MVDALDSGSSGRKAMGVRPSLSVPMITPDWTALDSRQDDWATLEAKTMAAREAMSKAITAMNNQIGASIAALESAQAHRMDILNKHRHRRWWGWWRR